MKAPSFKLKLSWIYIAEGLLIAYVALTLFLELQILIPLMLAPPLITPTVSEIWTVGSSGDGIGQFSNPQGLVADKNGNIYVADQGNHRIQKFNATGTTSSANIWKGDSDGLHPFENPSGLAISHENGLESIWVLDAGNGWIYDLKPDGRMEAVIPIANLGVYNPRGIAVTPSGDIYITDTGVSRILHLDQSGKLLGKWGSHGQGKNQFQEPIGIIFLDNSLFIADTHNNRIVQYTLDGKWMNAWKSGDECDWITADIDKKIYVSSVQNNNILIYSNHGTLISKLSSGKEIPQIDYPNGILAISKGTIIINTSNKLVQLKIDW